MGYTLHYKNSALSTLTFYLLLNTSHSLAADEDLFLQLSGDEKLISISTGIPQSVSKAPSVASVITASDIRNSGAKTVQEVLERVPGLHIGYGAFKGRSIYSIRGIHTEGNPHVLVMYNSVPIPSLLNGGTATNLHMPIENIQRIEIIRGPGTAIHGADAFAGVINIITRTEINTSRAGIKGGSFGTRSLWGQYGGKHAGWNIAASIEHNESQGDRSRIINNDLQSLQDGLLGTSASLAPGPLETRYHSLVSALALTRNEWTIQLNSWHEYDTGTGAGITNALDPVGNQDTEQYLLNVKYHKRNWRPDWSLQSNLSHFHLKTNELYNVLPPGTLMPVGSDGNFNFITPAGLVLFSDGVIDKPSSTHHITQFNLTTLYHGWNKHLWRFNAGLKHEKLETAEAKNFGPGVIDGSVSPIDGSLTDLTGTPFIYNPGGSRTISYLSIQDEWTFKPDWVLTAGLRADHYSDVGTTVNPRLSLVWNTKHNLTSKLLYSRAFRAPTFNELLVTNNPIALGNPNLEPENIHTLELAFEYKHTDSLSINLNTFHYLVNGLIEYQDDDGLPGGTATAQNLTDLEASGLEVEALWRASKQLHLFGSAALHNARDANTHERYSKTPRQQYHAGLHWQINNAWSTQLDAFHIMNRPRTTGDTHPDVADYTWVNLTVNVIKYLKGVDLQLAVRNLTDTDAREPSPTTIPNDYPLEGRSIMLGISIDLN